MTQPFPTPRPDTAAPIHVPVPDAVERLRDVYLQGMPSKLVALGAVALVLLLLVRLAGRQTQAIEDVNRRHTVRTWIRYTAVAVFALIAIALLADAMTGLGTVFALLAAGLAIALQDVLKSVVGWLYLSTRSGVQVGARIHANGVTGDVIDVGVLKTTVMEVGGELVHALQTTGRIVSIPNYAFLSQNVFVETVTTPFVWQEVKLVVTFESDWRRAEAAMREVAESHHAAIASEVEAGFRRMEKRFAFRPGTLTPIVYAALAPHGVDLTLRFLTHSRRRRGSVDRVTRHVLDRFAMEPGVELAYPTHRLFRLDDRVPGRAGAASMGADEARGEGGGGAGFGLDD